MIVGFGIIAVPTGIVSFELSRIPPSEANLSLPLVISELENQLAEAACITPRVR